MTHISTVIVAAVAYDVLTRIVTTTLATTPDWLLTAWLALVACSVALVVLGVGVLILFILELYWAVQKERHRHEL